MERKFLYIIIILGVFSCKNHDTYSLSNIENVKKSSKINDTISSIDQSVDSIHLEKKWLINFYSEYIDFYLNSPNAKDKSKTTIFFKELDSIKKKNCTQNFYNKQIEDFNKDFDYITNNEFICEQSLNSLEINQKKETDKTYAVSFIAEYPLNELDSEYKKTTFDVTIVNEKGIYKISKTCCF